MRDTECEQVAGDRCAGVQVCRCVLQVPVEVCGAGCVTEPGPQQCTDKQVGSQLQVKVCSSGVQVETLVQVPDEFCDIVPQQSCSQATKLVPRLRPKQECTAVPTEVAIAGDPGRKLSTCKIFVF